MRGKPYVNCVCYFYGKTQIDKFLCPSRDGCFCFKWKLLSHWKLLCISMIVQKGFACRTFMFLDTSMQMRSIQKEKRQCFGYMLVSEVNEKLKRQFLHPHTSFIIVWWREKARELTSNLYVCALKLSVSCIFMCSLSFVSR